MEAVFFGKIFLSQFGAIWAQNGPKMRFWGYLKIGSLVFSVFFFFLHAVRRPQILKCEEGRFFTKRFQPNQGPKWPKNEVLRVWVNLDSKLQISIYAPGRSKHHLFLFYIVLMKTRNVRNIRRYVAVLLWSYNTYVCFVSNASTKFVSGQYKIMK